MKTIRDLYLIVFSEYRIHSIFCRCDDVRGTMYFIAKEMILRGEM